MLELLAVRHIRYFCATVILLAFLSGVLRTAVPLLATQSGYTVTGVSWAQGLFSLAWPVFGIVAGTLLDRHNKVSLAVRSMTLFILLHVATVAMVSMQLAPPEHIFIYAIIAGIIVVSAEAYMMTIPPLIMAGAKLTTFYSIVLFLDFGFSYFLGPVAASFTLAHYPMAYYPLVITTLLLTIFCVRHAIPPLPETEKPVITTRYIMAGFNFIFSNRYLTSLTVITFFLSIVFGAFLTAFVFFVTDSQHIGLKASQYGVMFSAYAFGAMAGALGVRYLLRSTPVRTAVLADGLSTAALLIVPAFSNSVIMVWITTFLAGSGLSLWFVAVTAFRQRLTPPALLGRANAAFRVIGYAGMPTGSFLIGVLGSMVSLQFAATVIGSLLLSALIVTLPLLWSVDQLSQSKTSSA